MSAVNRVYSVINLKSVNEDSREFVGVATTPSSDRYNDIVEASGAQFTTPIPLLWQHDRYSPIGQVVSAKQTKDGIEVRCKIAKIDYPSGLVARLEEAWASIKSGLVRGLSIGFAPIEYSMLGNGGIHFLKWDWLELSAVTIPANSDCTITSIKSLDEKARAALGVRVTDKPKNSASVVAKIQKQKSIFEVKAMNYAEQIQGFEETKRLAVKKMSDLMEKAAAEGRGLDESESQEFDGAEAEVKAVDAQIERLKKLEAVSIKSAESVTDKFKGIATPAPTQTIFAIAKNTQKLDKGIEFARYVMCLVAARGNIELAKNIAANRFPDSERVNIALKAAVAAGTTTDATWASPLVEYNQFAGDFIDYLRPRTILGRFGRDGIPGLRTVPFNIHVRGQTSGGTGYWVGQGAPKPLTKFDFNDTYLGFAKMAGICVISEELARFSQPSAETMVRDQLAETLIALADTDFVSPTKAEVSNVSPASITYGVTAIHSSGNTASAIRADVASAYTGFINADITPTQGVWIMSSLVAMRLSLMRNALGQKEFPDMTMLGGMFEGLPVIASEYVPADSNGGFVILAQASDIWLADDGGITVEASREASLQMLDNPTNNSSSATPTTQVSMFQTNSIAVRAERYINWKKRRSQAVQVIDRIHWGE